MRPRMEARTMKALIPLLLVSTSALAVTTVQFAHRASTERKRAEDALAADRQHQLRIRELEKERGTLDQQLMDAQRPMVTSAQSIAPSAWKLDSHQPVAVASLTPQ